jgi:WD40 repeat protein
VSARQRRFGRVVPIGLLVFLLGAGTGTKLWLEARAGRVLVLEAPGFRANDVALSADGSSVAAVASGGRLVVWELPRGRVLLDAKLGTNDFLGPEQETLSPEGDVVAVTDRTTVVLVRVSSGSVLDSLKGSPVVWQLVFAPDGKELAVVESGGFVSLWSVPEIAPVQSFEYPRPVRNVAYSPRGDLLAIGVKDGLVHFRDRPTGHERPPQLSTGGDGYVRVGFDGDGRLLAASNRFTDRLVVWDLASPISFFSLPVESPGDVGIDARGRFVFVASEGRVRVGSIEEKTWLGVLDGSSSAFALASRKPLVAWIDPARRVRVGSLEGERWRACLESEPRLPGGG